MTRLLVPLLALSVVPSMMRADVAVCAAGTIASVLAQGPCTIGDKTFTFKTYSPYTYTSGTGANSDNSAAQIVFTPLTTDPNAPGFKLAAAFSSADGSTGPDRSYTVENGYLYFDVATTNLDSRITGTQATIEGSVLTTNPDSTCPVADYCYARGFAFAESILTTLDNTISYVQPYQIQYSGQAPSSTVLSYTSPPVSPVASASGYAFFETYADNSHNFGTGLSSSSASFTSADYLITEIAAVPEPSSVVLLVSMLGLVGFTMRRKCAREGNLE